MNTVTIVSIALLCFSLGMNFEFALIKLIDYIEDKKQEKNKKNKKESEQ